MVAGAEGTSSMLGFQTHAAMTGFYEGTKIPLHVFMLAHQVFYQLLSLQPLGWVLNLNGAFPYKQLPLKALYSIGEMISPDYKSGKSEPPMEMKSPVN